MKSTAIWMMTLAALMQGCTGMNVALISERDAKGKDVEQVVSELKARGLDCSKEYESKDVVTHQIYGMVACGSKGSAPICPSTYWVYITFNTRDRSVLGLSKFERQNCF